MKQVFSFALLFLIALASWSAQGQSTTLSGKVTEAGTGSPLPGASLVIKGSVLGTSSDGQGRFTLTTQLRFPLTLIVSAVGYVKQEVEVATPAPSLAISLEVQTNLMQEVVVSASRTEETIMRSPVSIEKMDQRTIQQTASPNFYDALQNMKSVDMVTN
jgi:hypothetical protein